MPVILTKDAYEVWLDKNLKDINRLITLLIPCDTDDMEAYEISPLVNSPKTNNPDLIKPLGNSSLF